MSPTSGRIDVDVGGVTRASDGVVSLSLQQRAGIALPEWQPGAHIGVHLPSGRVRQYSLHGDPADRFTYQISVLRVDAGRGASVELHDHVGPGTGLQIGLPRNTFGLQPAEHYLFLAGGIGITA